MRKKRQVRAISPDETVDFFTGPSAFHPDFGALLERTVKEWVAANSDEDSEQPLPA